MIIPGSRVLSLAVLAALPWAAAAPATARASVSAARPASPAGSLPRRLTPPPPGGWRSAAPRSSVPAASRAPSTPTGMAPCVDPLAPTSELPRAVGETIRYVVDVNGLSVGTIDFRVERHGTFGGRSVTEYRSQFKIDQLVGAVLPVQGRAASLVPDGSYWPAQAMTRYTIKQNELEDTQTYGAKGREVTSRRVRNGKPADESRAFPGPAQDFVSAFYVMRSLAPGASGCAILYGNQRAYTIWLHPDGTEDVMTPVGLKPARRYTVTWASDRSRKAAEGRVWLGDGPDRLPLKAELFGSTHLEARIHLYENGSS